MMKNKWTQNGVKITDGKRNLRVGDFVIYGALGAKYEGEWQVFGASEEGELLIISQKCVERLYLCGREGCEKGLTRLNEICTVYGKGEGATSSRSINIGDIENTYRYGTFGIREMRDMLYGAYWLASQGEYEWYGYKGTGLYASVYSGLTVCPFVTGDREWGFEFGVRVIVSLNKNIEVKSSVLV